MLEFAKLEMTVFLSTREGICMFQGYQYSSIGSGGYAGYNNGFLNLKLKTLVIRNKIHFSHLMPSFLLMDF